MKDGEPDILLLTDVPIALLVEVQEAHIVGVDFDHFLPLLLDLTIAIVLSLHAILSRFIIAYKSILLVRKRNLSRQLMTHIAHKNVEYVVTCIVKSNPLAILENNFFEAHSSQVCRLHAHLDAVLRPSIQFVVHVRAFNQKVRYGRMMTGLFHVDHRAILAHGLERFTKDWVQRLFEYLLLVEEGHVVGHKEFHAFERVLNRGSLVQEDNHRALKRRHQLQRRYRCHALDREANFRQVSLATEQLFPDHFDDFRGCAAQSLHQYGVSARETTIVASIIRSFII